MRYGGVDTTVREALSRSVWEAESAIGVADSDVVSLKCDRGGRFYKVGVNSS